MKKSKIFLASFIVLCILILLARIIIWTIHVSDKRGMYQIFAQGSLISICCALIYYVEDNRTFPSTLDLLVTKKYISEDELKSYYLTFWGKIKEAPFFYNNRLVAGKKYPPKTIMAAQPWPIKDSRYVLFWFDFTKVTDENRRYITDNICKISEKEFQQLQARSNWPIPPAKPEDSKYYER